jgi:hypothetical protein
VHVEFDGEGGSGQIESETAFQGEERTDLLVTRISVQNARGERPNPPPCNRDSEARLKPTVMAISKRRTAVGKTTKEASANSTSTFSGRTVELEFHGRFTETFTGNHTF